MYIKKLFFPGKFDEAFIYMQKLLLFDGEGSLFFVHLGHVARYLEQQNDSVLKTIPTHLFARNDWFSGERFTSLFSNKLIRNAFLNALKRFPDEIEMDSTRFVHSIARSKVTDILDVNVYNRRLYMATDNGMYHLDLDWGENAIELIKKPEKRHDALCTQVNAKYGSISISCGDDGLFTQFDEFGQLGDSYNINMRWQEAAPKSFRTNWLFEDLVNYTSPTEPVLLKIRRSDTPSHEAEMRTREKVAVGFQGNPVELDYLWSNTVTNEVQESHFLFLYNISNGFLAQTQERALLNIPVKHAIDSPDLVASTVKPLLNSLPTRILDAIPVRRNFVLELYDSVQLLADNQLHKLVDGEVLSLKSYPYSKRFQNLLTVVGENGVYVISVFNEQDKSI